MVNRTYQSKLNKIKFHHAQAMRSNITACTVLRNLLIQLMKERKIPEGQLYTARTGGSSFIRTYYRGDKLYFREICPELESGYLDGDSDLIVWSTYPDMVALFKALTNSSILDEIIDEPSYPWNCDVLENLFYGGTYQ